MNFQKQDDGKTFKYPYPPKTETHYNNRFNRLVVSSSLVTLYSIIQVSHFVDSFSLYETCSSCGGQQRENNVLIMAV